MEIKRTKKTKKKHFISHYIVEIGVDELFGIVEVGKENIESISDEATLGVAISVANTVSHWFFLRCLNSIQK